MNYPTDKELEEVRTRWFPDHKATVRDLGNDMLRIYWAKPNTSIYSIVYIIDHGTLCVYGDLGDAIYQWSGKINLHFLRALDLGYFHSKCQASENGRISDNYEFSFDRFAEGLRKRIADAKEEGSTHLDGIDMESFRWCEEDEYGAIAWLRDQKDLDGEEIGSLLGEGKTIPLRCASHLIGLKMIAEQLDPS